MDKLSYLSQFRKNIEFASADKIKDLGTDVIPSQWLEIIQEEDKNNRVKKTLALWNSLFHEEFSNTILYLTDHLIDVELISDNGKYAILYSIKDPQGHEVYYEGGLPVKETEHAALLNVWRDVPQKVRIFYEQLHDGFYYFASRAMGLVSLANVTFFEEDEWGIIDDLDEPLKINLSTTYSFFESGMGGYLAIDLENGNAENATLWFTSDQPEYGVNFWDVADEWMIIGFEE